MNNFYNNRMKKIKQLIYAFANITTKSYLILMLLTVAFFEEKFIGFNMKFKLYSCYFSSNLSLLILAYLKEISRKQARAFNFMKEIQS